jgi:DNA-binding IclR family transcriptional regulator
VQDERRAYHPGPAMGAGPAERGWTREFTDVCRPHMETLALDCGETVNLVIRVGTQVRFLSTVESSAMLRIGDRQGQVLPAERASGGRALLAELDDDLLGRLYADRDPRDLDQLRHESAAIRRAGYALNVEQTEEGVAAFGMSVHNREGQALGAVTVAVPAVRYRVHAQGQLVTRLRRAVHEMEVDLASQLPHLTT